MRELSASRIKTMDDCGKLFYHKYILKDYEETYSPHAAMGGAVHKVLEVYRENTDMTKKEMIALFHEEFESTDDTKWIAKQGYQMIYKMDLSKIVIGELISVEQSFEQEYGDALMRGVIDKVERVDDTLVVTDYKTNMKPEPKGYMHQLAIYDMAMERLYPGSKRKFELLYVRHNKSFMFQFDENQHEKVASATIQTAKLITENETNPGYWRQLKEKTPVCSYCSLAKKCWK